MTAPGRQSRRANRWPEGRAKRRRASTAGRPDRRTAWASTVGRRANRWPARSATAWANRWPEGRAKRRRASTAGRPDRRTVWASTVGRRASTAGRPRSANRLGRQPLAGGRTVGRRAGQSAGGRQPLAGPIGNRLGVNRWPARWQAPGRQPLAGPIGEPPGRQPLAGPIGNRRANRWPARSATAWANRWPARSANRRRASTAGRPDRRTAWASTAGRRANRLGRQPQSANKRAGITGPTIPTLTFGLADVADKFINAGFHPIPGKMCITDSNVIGVDNPQSRPALVPVEVGKIGTIEGKIIILQHVIKRIDRTALALVINAPVDLPANSLRRG